MFAESSDPLLDGEAPLEVEEGETLKNKGFILLIVLLAFPIVFNIGVNVQFAHGSHLLTSNLAAQTFSEGIIELKDEQYYSNVESELSAMGLSIIETSLLTVNFFV
ncbi:MAG: hypothetical protein ACTSSJ_07505 [Candidatus Odinarchaeia archaeon]